MLRDQVHFARFAGAQLANQAVLAARAAVGAYYDAELRSDDELAPARTRDICLACVQLPNAVPSSGFSTIVGLPMPERVP